MRIILSILLTLTGALCFGCRSTDRIGEFHRFQRPLDELQLGEKCVAGGLEFSAPRAWAAYATTDSMTRLLRDPSSGSCLFISRFEPMGDFALWAEKQVQIYRSANRRSSIGEEWLMVNGVRVVQLIDADTTQVRFRLYLDGTPPVLLDYLVPQKALPEQIRAVESSMGSIRRGESDQ